MCGKLACGSTLFSGGGVWGHTHARKILEFRTSEIASARFSGQVSVAKIIHISSIQEALSLLFSRPDLSIHASLDRVLILSRAQCSDASVGLAQARPN